MIPGAPAAAFWRVPLWWKRLGAASLASLFTAILGLGVSVVLARGLGAHEYGLVLLASALPTGIYAFLDVPFDEAVVHFGAQDLAVNDGRGLRRIILDAALFDVVIGVGAFCAVVTLAPVLVRIVGQPDLSPNFVRLAALTPLALTIDGTTGAALLLSGRADLRAYANLVAGLGRLLGALLAVNALASRGPGAALVLLAGGTLLGSLVQAGTAWVLGRRLTGVAERGAPKAPEYQGASRRQILAFASHSGFSSSLGAVEQAVLPIAIGREVDSATVGHFRVAQLPLTIAALVTVPIRAAALPELAALWAAGQRQTVYNAYLRVTIGILAFGVALSGLAVLTLPTLMSLVYGPAYASSVTPSKIYAVVSVASLVTAWSKLTTVVLGRPAIRSAVALLSAALSIPSVWYGAAEGEVLGAAIGHGMAMVLGSALIFCLTVRQFRQPR